MSTVRKIKENTRIHINENILESFVGAQQHIDTIDNHRVLEDAVRALALRRRSRPATQTQSQAVHGGALVEQGGGRRWGKRR